MKIIKSFFLLTVGFCATTIVYAQELKPEIAKPLEAKIPAAANNRPSPQPELKPQLQAAPEVPSPLTRKEEAKPAVNEKLEAKTVNKNEIATPGGEEGKKIMAGNTTRPTDPIYSPSTIDPKPAPQVKPAKPANGQQQQ
jgi:hypothetical protein